MKKSYILMIVLFFITMLVVLSCKQNSNPAAAATSTPAVIMTSTFTATITPTSTSTITPDAGSKTYSFETTNDGWDTTSAAVTSVARNTNASFVYAGVGSLGIGCSFTNAPVYYSGFIGKYFLSNPVDLRGKTVTFHVYVPSDLAAISPPYDVQLAFVDGIGNSWVRQNGQTLTLAGWNTVSFVCPSTSDYSYVYLITFTMEKGSGYTSPSWAGTVYLDEISW